MITCVSCGRLNVDTAVFCAKCGRRLTDDRVTCPKCGTKNRKDERACIQCGVDLRKAWDDVRREPVTQPLRKPGFVPRRTATMIANALLVVLVLVVVILAFTNPKRADHLQAVELTYNNLAAQAASAGDAVPGQPSPVDLTISQWFQGLSQQEKTAYFSQFRYHNYLVLSTTSYKGQTQTFGVLKNVLHRLDIGQPISQ